MAIPKNASYLTVTNYRDLLRQMRKIEPGMLKDFRREARKIGNPMRNQISQGIPRSAALSNMTPQVNKVGRLAWGRGVAANKAVLDTRIPPKSKKEGALIRVVVSSPATVMADMAGRSGKYIGKREIAAGTKSNTYAYETRDGRVIFGYKYTYHRRDGEVIGGRRHKNTGAQGRAMIRGLGKKPSRYVYPSAEKSLPAVRIQMMQVVDKYCVAFNRVLRSR